MPSQVHPAEFNDLIPNQGYEGAEVNMFPQRFSLLPTNFQDATLEATYVKVRTPHIQRQARRVCHFCALALAVQTALLGPDPQKNKGESAGTVVRVLLILLLLCSPWLLRFRAEVSSVSLCSTLILCFPLLSHGRMCWLTGKEQSELVAWVGKGSPDSETQFVLFMLTLAVSFLALVPVRVQICWVVPALVPLVYLGFTLPLPEVHLQDSFVNRVTIGCLLGIICSTLLVGKAQFEILFREQFSKADAAAKATSREKVHCLDTEFIGATMPQSDCDSGAHLPSLLAQHSTSWTRQQPAEKLCSNAAEKSCSSRSERTVSYDSLFCLSADSSSSSSCETKALCSKIHDLTKELDQLKVELAACHYVNNIGSVAVAKLVDKHMKDIQKQHWLRTRTVIACMDKANKTVQRKRHRHTRSLSLSESSLRLAMESLQQRSRLRQSASNHEACSHEIEEHSHDGNGGSCSGGHGRNSGIGVIARTAGPSLHCFDGTWELIGENPDVANCFRRLDINGFCVIDGTGEVTTLVRTVDHKVLLDGGVLQLHGERLCRTGKSGTKLEFRQVATRTKSDGRASLLYCIHAHAKEMQASTGPPVA